MTQTAPEPAVLVEVVDAVATVTLNRPERRNSFVPELGEAMTSVLTALRADPAVRVVVLTGAGGSFSVGGDLAAGLGPMLGPPPLQDQYSRLRGHTAVSELLRDLPQVTIAAVNGACAGAGLSFALCCDLRVAASSAKFATAFLGAGVSGDFGGIWLATRLLGAARANELFLLGERIDAAEALRLGLVTRVLPD
jgi:2-(1,2-epoxy-1,2-dihydrophenyl)acetyl-CoA isomerase